MRVLMIGLDTAGKTTILNKLKKFEGVTTIPTIGYNVEIVECRNLRFIVYDCGGHRDVRPIWQCFAFNCTVVMYVIDSTNRERIDEAKSELSKMLENEYLRDSVILMLANKQDLPNALTSTELAEKMRMHQRKHQWYVQATCAYSGCGLDEGLNYLHKMLSNRSSVNKQ